MIVLRKSPALVRGLVGYTRSFAPRRGLGQPPGYLEVCDQSTVSAQWACAQRNMVRQDEYYSGSSPAYAENHGGVTPAQVVMNSSYAAQLPPGNWACEGGVCVNTATGERRTVTPSPVVAPIPATYAAYLAPAAAVVPPATGQPPVAPTVYRPSVSFTGSGKLVRVGDPWVIRVTGGRPNTAVTATGGKDGATDTNRMGTTDASGALSLTGRFSASEVGGWSERWAVGSDDAGGFSFRVIPAETVAGTAIPPIPSVPGPAAGNGSGSDTGSFFTDSLLWGIPNWALLAGLGVGGVMLAGGRGR